MTHRPGSGHTLGVAIEIPDPVGSRIDRARERFGPLDASMPAHVTLLAPVDVDDDVLAAVRHHLRAVADDTAPFVLHLRGSDSFRPVSPVVFVSVVEGDRECGHLERRVRSGDLAVESRFPYHPHVTVAHGGGEEQLDRALAEFAGFDEQVPAAGMCLRENVGGRWVLLEEFAFRG